MSNKKHSSNQVWVSPADDAWKVKQPDNSKASAICQTQKEAISIAHKIAQNQGKELIVQGRNGQIVRKDSFGHDPRNIKG